ncbi:MAG: PEP-CTERM sorting domain-containing protein [Pseudomonadota bacterium]
MRKTVAILLALIAFGPATAAASLIKFEYTFASGSVLEGRVDGTVLGDGDTFLVNGFGDVTLDNILLNTIEASDICSGSDFPNCGQNPVMSFSGMVMDVFVCSLGFNNGNCSFSSDGGFFFATSGPFQFARAGAPGPGVGLVTDFTYSPNRWSAVEVPEPTTLALLGLGLLSVAIIRRRPTAKLSDARIG